MISWWLEGEGSPVPAQVARRGAVPGLWGCRLGSMGLYSTVLISLTCYLRKEGKGRNGGSAHREAATVGPLHRRRQFRVQDAPCAK